MISIALSLLVSFSFSRALMPCYAASKCSNGLQVVMADISIEVNGYESFADHTSYVVKITIDGTEVRILMYDNNTVKIIIYFRRQGS